MGRVCLISFSSLHKTCYPAEQIHTVSLATLDNECAKVLTTEELIKKLNLTEAIQS